MLFIITLEIFFVSSIILVLYRLKPWFGLTLLYIFLGSNLYMQAILASSVYFKTIGESAISPGSVVLFTSILFTILLIYLKEDIPQTRTLLS